MRGRRPAGGTPWRVRIEARERTFGSVWALRGTGTCASPTGPRRDCCRPPPTRSGRRWPRTGSRPRTRRPRSRARATSSRRRCCSRCRTTSGRRWRRSARRPGRCGRTAASAAEDRRESAEAIDREVEYLNRLVTNLLDLSRIEAGALRADRDAFELDDLVGQDGGATPRAPGASTARGSARRRRRCDVDPIFLDEAVDQRPRERAQVHAARRADPDRSRHDSASRPGPPDGRGRRPRCSDDCPAQALREVLPRAGSAAGRLAFGDRDRPRRRRAAWSRRWAAGSPRGGARSAALRWTWTCRSPSSAATAADEGDRA